jgi:hypothetical protein
MAARPGFDQRDSFPEVVPSVLPEVVDKSPQNRLHSSFNPHRSQPGVVTASPSGTSRTGDYTAHQRTNSSSTPDLDEDIYSDNSRQYTPLASTYSISGQASGIGPHVDTYQPQGSAQSDDNAPLNGSRRTRPLIEDRGFSVVSDLSGQNALVEYESQHMFLQSLGADSTVASSSFTAFRAIQKRRLPLHLQLRGLTLKLPVSRKNPRILSIVSENNRASINRLGQAHCSLIFSGHLTFLLRNQTSHAREY